MTAQAIADRLQAKPSGADSWMAKCPAHEDHNPSLCIKGTGDKVLIKCHAGCPTETVCAALGITVKDLFTKPATAPAPKRIVAEYSYTDEGGTPLYQVVRYDPKDFRQRKPDGTWKLGDTRRVLYRLPDVLAAIERGATIFLVEGEKDADALSKVGLCATCNCGGAESSPTGKKWLPAYTQDLGGADVVILPDKDAPGRLHGQIVAGHLHGRAASVRVLELPDRNGRHCKDAADFVAAGGTAEDILRLVESAPLFRGAAPVCEPSHCEVAHEPPPGEDEKLTEFDYANFLADRLPPIRTCGNVWFGYRDGVWKETSRAIFRPAAQDVLPPGIRTARREAALLDHLEGRFQTDPELFAGFNKFDGGDGVLINASNGLVQVYPDQINLLPHSPDHNFTRATAVAYNPEATAPTYERVLGEVLPDPEDRNLFELCLGNFLYPDCRFETALVCYGEAGRGKSTVADPIANVLGKGLVSRLSMTQICDPKSYSLPTLKFASVNLGTELESADIGESGNFKTLVSGEPIDARPIYGEPFTMQSSCKLMFLANSLPRFKRGTEAELRRTRFLRFDYQPPVKDVGLKSKLASESEGVFLIMLRGLQALMARRDIPTGGVESRAVHGRFRVSNDPVGTFVEEHCTLDCTLVESKDSIREAYAEFCEKYQIPAVCAEWFFRNLFDRFPALIESKRRVNGTRQRCISGIGLRPPPIEIDY